MLTKLLKYDLIETFKPILPVYLFSIISAFAYLLAKSFAKVTTLIMVSSQLLMILLVFALVATMFVTLFSIAMRYYNNVLRDEGYLTNTLPVSKNSILLAKLISAALALVASALLVTLLFKLCFTNFSDFSFMNQSFLPGVLTSNLIYVSSLVLFLQGLSLIINFYTAITLGHSHSNNKIVYSLIYGVVIYVSLQVLAILAIAITLYFSDSFIYFDESSIEGGKTIINILLTCAFVFTAWCISGYFITKTTLKNKLNLE